MDLIIKIGFFLLFLVVYSGSVYGAYLVTGRSNRRPLSSGATWYTGLAGIAQVLLVTTYLYLLARFFNVWLSVMLLMVAAVSLILALMIRAVSSKTQLVEGLWEGFGLGARTPAVPKAFGIIGMIVIGGYPIAAGIVYFTHDIPSPAATLWVLGLTLLGLFLAGQLLIVLTTGPLLLSQYVEDDARKSILVGRSLTLITGGVYLALTFYAFNVVRQGGSFSLGRAFGELSLAFTLALVAYFIATALVPYFVGSKRSVAWQGAFQAARESLVDDLLESLAVPGKAIKLERLERLTVRQNGEEADLRGDQLVTMWEAIDQGEADPAKFPEIIRGTMEALGESKDEFRRRDPRFQQRDWLADFGQQLGAIADAIQSKRTEQQVKELSNDWIAFYRGQRDELAKRVAAAGPVKSRLATATSFLVSTGLIGIVTSEVAKIIAERVATSAGR